MYCIKKILSRTLTSEQKYKLYKNKLTTILTFAEKSYYSSLLVANRGDSKSTWNVLNTVINKKICPNELPKHFGCNGEDISDTSIIANKCNTFFATIGPNLANALPTSLNIVLYPIHWQPPPRVPRQKRQPPSH